MSLKRADLVIQDLFPELTRSKIQSLIEREKILQLRANGIWTTLKKTGSKIESAGLKASDFRILEDDEVSFVSRGALKLKAAIETFSIEVASRTCLDVGLSTGGFTDYLLQKEALRILGIDVGRDQLHRSLKGDKRVVAYDKINARNPIPDDILKSFFEAPPFLFDLIVIDVSFISLTKIIANISSYLAPGGNLVALVKPQFELQRSSLNKKGVVKDENEVNAVIQNIIGVFTESKLNIVGQCPSPIEGENGNKEILLVASKP